MTKPQKALYEARGIAISERTGKPHYACRRQALPNESTPRILFYPLCIGPHVWRRNEIRQIARIEAGLFRG